MDQHLRAVAEQCPEIDQERVARHLQRLPTTYLRRFEDEAIAEHLRLLAQLGPDRPTVVEVNLAGEQVQCVIAGFDRPFAFSLIAGVLASMGLEIQTGDIFTLPAADPGAGGEAPPRRTTGRQWYKRHSAATAARRSRDAFNSDVLLDVLAGKRSAGGPRADDAWAAQLQEALAGVLRLLDSGDPTAADKAKKLVNERVTERLAQAPPAVAARAMPLAIDAQTLSPQRLRLIVTATDTPAFLYALGTAVSLHGLDIARIRIDSDPDSDRIVDEIDLVLPASTGAFDAELVQRIRLTVSLTKQFTYYLDASPDPFTALSRFERLAEDLLTSDAGRADAASLDLLGDPQVLRDLARLLGASDFLWEEHIRGRYRPLLRALDRHARGLPIGEPAETIPRRLDDALAPAVGLAEQQDRLNAFKDHELFLTDLEHILLPGATPRGFAERLTLLAEHLLATAVKLVSDDLIRSYGKIAGARAEASTPASQIRGQTSQSGHALPFCVFGLGKLGGIALGYGSDMELLFIYDADPNAKTTGGKRGSIAASAFFEQIAKEAAQFIRTRRGGIFEADLRLRPYGKDSPLAASAQQFASYYGPDGPAHPFERLALVRLRWIAGSPELGYRVEQTRDRLVYDHPDRTLDLDALWDVWARSRRERLGREKRFNAKHSLGALTDLESALQLLQVAHARRVPQLRTPRLSRAMEALRLGGVISTREYEQVLGAYHFFRRLVNALRMLRGSAADLLLPPAEALELKHLARRMGYRLLDAADASPPAERLLRDCDRHAEAVRRFVEHHFARPLPT